MIWPGSLAAKPTTPLPPCALYSVMKRPPPPNARPSAPKKLRAPAVWVVVLSCTLSVIQENSPGSAIMTSPGSKPTSSTGIVVPVIFDCISPSPSEYSQTQFRLLQIQRLSGEVLGAFH